MEEARKEILASILDSSAYDRCKCEKLFGIWWIGIID